MTKFHILQCQWASSMAKGIVPHGRPGACPRPSLSSELLLSHGSPVFCDFNSQRVGRVKTYATTNLGQFWSTNPWVLDPFPPCLTASLLTTAAACYQVLESNIENLQRTMRKLLGKESSEPEGVRFLLPGDE